MPAAGAFLESSPFLSTCAVHRTVEKQEKPVGKTTAHARWARNNNTAGCELNGMAASTFGSNFVNVWRRAFCSKQKICTAALCWQPSTLQGGLEPSSICLTAVALMYRAFLYRLYALPDSLDIY